MKIKAIAQACMWLPGFAPDEDPFEVLGTLGTFTVKGAENDEEHQQQAIWPMLEESHHAQISTAVPKYEANIAAIKLLRKLEDEGRNANAQEHAILSQYTGWGGLVKALDGRTSDTAWLTRHAELKALLTDKEFDSATTSSLNAYYTPLHVVKAMWNAVRKMGFNGGKVIEPACGVGYFLGGMPEDLARKSRITAVELDDVSARMTKVMYEQYGVKVIKGEFENARLPHGAFDLAIGNPPFGDEMSAELRNVPFSKFTLHNYFIAKALELVRPGGLVVFITSTGTMDSHSNGHREYINREAELVQAVRLPQGTFKEIAGTSVTTDLLIFRKREKRTPRATEAAWLQSVILPRSSPINGAQWNSMQVNEYFVHNPRGVIGKLNTSTSKHGLSKICEYEGDVNAALDERILELPEGLYVPKSDESDSNGKELGQIVLEEVRRPGLVQIEGRIYEVDGNTATPHGKPGKAQARLISLIEVRDSLRALIAAQAAGLADDVTMRMRIALNVTYDRHVTEFGYLNNAQNKRAFSPDPDLPLLLSAEQWDAKNQVASKAPIFDRNTLEKVRRVERCASTQEALQVSLAESARVVPARIAELCDRPVHEVVKELSDADMIFLDPETDNWEASDSYLSGNIRRKILVAEAAGVEFEKNVTALKAVMPKQLRADEIVARIGSTWIPAKYYGQFLDETFDCKDNKVTFDSRVGAWSTNLNYSLERGVAGTQTYGTKRVNAGSLFEMELNQRRPTVYDTKSDGSRVVNVQETIVAREKQHMLKQAFVQWLWKDDERSRVLVDVYNEMFRSVVAQKFDGRHLVLPGMSGVYTLRSHQRDAIWRVISSKYNTLLAHAVGAGKTLEMICAGMELRRLGMAKKIMYVVPNHMLLDFASDFLKTYPIAKVLVASKDDLTGVKRKLMLARIATHDWDAVVVTQATFESIKVSDEYMKAHIDEEVFAIESAIREYGNYDRGSIVKELAKAKKTWENRLKKISNHSKKDGLLTFEELGIDYLVCDEAHAYKNAHRFTKMDRIAGLPNTNSQRAFDVHVKLQHIQNTRRDGKGVLMATATPISNSVAELWTFMRYLSKDLLAEYGCEHFDSWASNFGEAVTALELSPDGSGYRMQTRFARFVNVPELMNMFRQVADIRTAEMLNLPVPVAERHTITVESSEDLKEYVSELVERAQKIREGGIKPSEDNMLKVTGDGRKAALDVRLVGLATPMDKSGKIYECARNVHRLWVEYTESKAAQIVFCDLSTPSATKEFTAYHELRKELVELGVTESEIAFIHDHDSDSQKEELFQAVRSGIIRVVVGSTSKLGMGTNIQDQLIALHHLDLPWRTSDLEQRDGRIVRQGNMFSKVFIYIYITRASFDAYMAQTLHTKAKFIAQVMMGNDEIRTLEDVEAATLSFAEIKSIASGNPMVIEKATVDAELAKLAVVRQAWARQQRDNQYEINALPGQIKATVASIENIKADMAEVVKAGATLALKIDGVTIGNDSHSLAVVEHAIQRARQSYSVFGTASDFKVCIKQVYEDVWMLRLERKHVYSGFNLHGADGAVHVVKSAIAGMNADLVRLQRRVPELERTLAELKVEVTKPFDQDDRFLALVKRQSEIETQLELTAGDVAAVDESEISEEAVAA